MKSVFVTFIISSVALARGAIEARARSESSLTGGDRHSDDAKDLETSASDRTFLLSNDGYSNGYDYGYNPDVIYGYNRVYDPNSVYRGYSSGTSGLLGGTNRGYGYYGAGYDGLRYGSRYGYGLGYASNYGGYGSDTYGNYGGGYGGYGSYGSGYGYDDRILGGRGYNLRNNLDGYRGYSGLGGASGYGYSGYNGYSNYPYGSRGSEFYGGYPSGYRGYS